jgi:saccharopine dehydrogenase-like NADP-dependent oxidoreductase
VKVAVLGAGGTIAPALVHDLASSDEVSELLLLDLDEERARAVASAHGQGKAKPRRADARAGIDEPGSIARAISRFDVLVNSASYRVNLDAMRASLAGECHYIDLGGLYWMTSRQLQLSSEFERAGLLALLGMGSAPGKTNLMAARVASQLAEVDSIQISAASRDQHPPAAFSIPYALQTLLDELTMKPVVTRDGRQTEIEPLADAGAVDFGPPIGEAETIYTLHSELLTFADSFGCREASFRLSLTPKLLTKLRELRGASAQRIARAAAEAKPASQKTFSVHLVEATGAGKRATLRCVTHPLSDWHLGGGVVSTAAPAAAAVRLLARGDVSARGALPPERALDPKQVFSELERRGSRFELEIVREAVPAVAAAGSDRDRTEVA